MRRRAWPGFDHGRRTGVELIHEVLVGTDVEQHSCAATAPGEDEGSLRGAHLLEHGRCVGAKVGHRLDVGFEVDCVLYSLQGAIGSTRPAQRRVL